MTALQSRRRRSTKNQILEPDALTFARRHGTTQSKSLDDVQPIKIVHTSVRAHLYTCGTQGAYPNRTSRYLQHVCVYIYMQENLTTELILTIVGRSPRYDLKPQLTPVES